MIPYAKGRKVSAGRAGQAQRRPWLRGAVRLSLCHRARRGLYLPDRFGRPDAARGIRALLGRT